MSFYRPSYNGGLHYDDVPPPPPLPDSPPPPPSNGRGMRDSWRPSAPPSRDFTFRNPPTGPAYPQERDHNEARRARQPDQRRRQPGRANDRRNLNPDRRNRPQYGRGGKRIPIKASARPLLHQEYGEDADMEMLGVDATGAKYLAIEDSDESDSEPSRSGQSARSEKEYSEGLDGAVDDELLQPPTKRRNVNGSNDDGNERPKWCNPDPYSEHAPIIDDSTVKKKDPIETIRKYRKMDGEKVASSNQVADNDDFISFDMDGDASEESRDKREPPLRRHDDVGLSNSNSELNGRREEDATEYAVQEYAKDHDFVARTRSQIPDGDIILDTNPGSFRHESERYDDYGNGGRGRKRDHTGRPIKSAVPLPSANGLIEEWWPTRDTNPIPWFNKPKYITAKSGLQLHMEICDFFEFVKPQKFEEAAREDLIVRIQNMVDEILPGCSVRCFGSFASGLYLPNADMDLVVMSKSYMDGGQPSVCQSGNKLTGFGAKLRKNNMAKDNQVTVIPHAKVPLVKFVDRKTNIKVDISFENDSGVVALGTFEKWKRQYPAMPIIVVLIKQFLLMRAQNEVQVGGIGGFTVTCLVTSLLQNMPRVQTGELKPESHLGEILIEFLDFYGNRFDVFRTGITMEPPGYFDKHAYNQSIMKARSGMKPSQPDRIAILDPNKVNNDISGGSKNVMSIFEQFSEAHREILLGMKARNRPSLLDWMLGGNYIEVMRQRNFLRDLQSSGKDRLSHSVQASVRAAPEMAPSKSWVNTGHTKQQQEKEVHGVGSHSEKAKPAQEQKSKLTAGAGKGKSQPAKPTDGATEAGDLARADALKRRFPQRTDLPRTITKAQSTVLISQSEYDAERAQNLRREYPDMRGIPREISKSKRQRLVQRYEQKTSSGVQSNGMVLTKSKGTSHASKGYDAANGAGSTRSDVPAAKVQSHGSKLPANHGPRFFAANSGSGSTNINPIELD